MEITVRMERDNKWVCRITTIEDRTERLLYFNTGFSSYDRAKRDAEARLSEFERIAAR